MRPAERPPCRVFCHLRLEALHGFLTMRFGVRCLRQEIGAVLNITCSMAVSSKSGNTKLVADALQRELSDAGVRFVASFDLDAADAESAQSEGAEGAEEAEGAEKAEGVESAKSAEGAENGQGTNADVSVPTASVPVASAPSISTLAAQAGEALAIQLPGAGNLNKQGGETAVKCIGKARRCADDTGIGGRG